MVKFEIFSAPKVFYKKMIDDIKNAKSYIYLETFIYRDDIVGRKFREELTKKSKQNVRVKILIDAWGAKIPRDYFSELEKYGGEVRYFREIKYVLRFATKNHERNHRKLLLIDGKISYIGSANINADFINGGRELVMKLGGDITHAFSKTFLRNWEDSGGLNKKKLKSIIYRGFEIIEDLPSEIYRITENRYIKLIKQAKKEILIESPYFIPSRRIRKVFAKAVNRGVDVKVIIPFDSDEYVADIVRNRYLGDAYKKGVKIYYYPPRSLHSKLLIVDNKFFLLGSSNLDYRSFLHQYEINLLGKDKRMIMALKESFNSALKKCREFDYDEWKKRSSFKKFPELFLYFIRRYV